MKKVLLTCILMAMASTSTGAFAAASEMVANGGTIKFIGSVTDAPCAISMALKDHVVIMKQVRTAHLTSDGVASGQPTSFTVDLEDCDTTTYKNAALTFSGTADSSVTTALANQSTAADAATNVALQIYDDKGTEIDLGTASTPVTLQDGTNKIPLKVDYVASGGQATAGSVEATATVQITYS